jgi:hypothetical protein
LRNDEPALRQLYRDERGAGTIAEVLASIVVSAMAMAALYQITLMQDRVYSVQNQLAEMEQIAEAAKTMMMRELDMAGYKPVPAVVFNGITLDSTQLRIRADLNGNGTTTDAREDINYRLDALNRRLIRTTDGKQNIFPNIQAFTIEYLKADGTAATTSAEIRQVNVTLVARTERRDPDYHQNNGYRTLRLDYAVTPRNLGL